MSFLITYRNTPRNDQHGFNYHTSDYILSLIIFTVHDIRVAIRSTFELSVTMFFILEELRILSNIKYDILKYIHFQKTVLFLVDLV